MEPRKGGTSTRRWLPNVACMTAKLVAPGKSNSVTLKTTTACELQSDYQLVVEIQEAKSGLMRREQGALTEASEIQSRRRVEL